MTSDIGNASNTAATLLPHLATHHIEDLASQCGIQGAREDREKLIGSILTFVDKYPEKAPVLTTAEKPLKVALEPDGTYFFGGFEHSLFRLEKRRSGHFRRIE